MELNRRGLLALTARAAALPGATQFFPDWLKAAGEQEHTTQAPAGSVDLAHYTPRFFDEGDFEVLRYITAILIPSDETPGAREARCAEFIDFVLSSAADDPAMRQRWRDSMAALRAAGFHAASGSRRLEIIEIISEPERNAAAQHPAFPAYRLIKTQNAFAYFTSREGMIGMLDYKGNSYNPVFPACAHPEHQSV